MFSDRFFIFSCPEDFMRTAPARELRALIAAFVGLMMIVGGCAQVGRPPGGPADETPPVLQSAEPGSLAVGVDPAAPLRLSFSEKIDRRSVARALTLVPDVEVQKPRFEDLDVVFRPLRGWPADTVVVWTLGTGLTDKHRVRIEEERRGAFTTGPSLPPGRIVGRAAVRDTSQAKLTSLRAQLSLPPPEGSRRRRPWRDSAGQDRGHFELDWLILPSGPYQLDVFLDTDKDGRVGEKERSARLDSLMLGAADSILDVGTLLLLDRVSPVELTFHVAIDDSQRVQLWVAELPDLDDPQSATADSNGYASFSLRPAEYRWGAWVDLDSDGRWGPDSLRRRERHGEAELFVVEPEYPDTLRFSGPWELGDLPADSTRARRFPSSLELREADTDSTREAGH
jgi:Bacterial Ig-like domain